MRTAVIVEADPVGDDARGVLASQSPVPPRPATGQRHRTASRRNSGVDLFPFPIENLLVPQLVLSIFSGQVRPSPEAYAAVVIYWL